jgi:Flp pilus assembly protein TadG
MRLTRKSDVGAVAVIMAMFAVIMFVCAALVVDLGFARAVRREAQNSADAAALAGAGAMYDKTGNLQPAASIKAVKDYSASNFDTSDTDWALCTATIPAGWTTTVGVGANARDSGTTCIAYDNAAKPQIVQVVEPFQHTGTFFGGIVGYHGSDISALAQASIEPKSHVTCVVCVMGNWDGQNGDALVTNGGVAINGDLTTGPNGTVTAQGGIGVAGSGLPDPHLTPSGTQIGHFTDPLADIPLPPAPLGQIAVDGSGACAPGSYVSVLGCGSFAAGVYTIVGNNTLNGQQNLTATPTGGVLFYFTCADVTGHGNNAVYTTRACAPGESGGAIDAAGQGNLTISGRLYGSRTFSIIYDRNNTAEVRLVGNGATSITGDIYALSSVFDARGNGTFDVNSLIVTGAFRFDGNPSRFTDNYTGEAAESSGPKDLRLIK